MTVSVVLADDHQVIREGLQALLSQEKDLDVIGQAADGVETLRVVSARRPDILILDLAMPGLPGLEVMRRVATVSPGTKVVVLSMYSDEEYVIQALRNQAAAYVVKSAGADQLIIAIRQAMAGEHYLSPPLSEDLVETYETRAEALAVDPYDSLTPREREIMHLAASGHTNKEIGTRLSISRRTVEAHRANLMSKLRLKTQADLVRYAIGKEAGLGG